jgi:hypothetical protein
MPGRGYEASRGPGVSKGTEVNWEEIIPPGFHVLPRRWIVERPFAWIGRHRRMSKDFKYLLNSSGSMVCLTMIRLMVKRLARAVEFSREQVWQAYAA